uniref:Putative type-4 fimbrial biogenesis PilV transmembrane protein n=1 Tax=mine drainage metagenome TaxID=410659 RepID=E6PLK4_9ZZZZ
MKPRKKTQGRPWSTHKFQSGFSLIEVLIALLVIAIGLLGIAGMQALALSNTSTARQRSLAAIQAASMGSMMRANRGYWESASSVDVTVTGSLSGTSWSSTTLSGSVSSQGTDCETSVCSAPLQMAAYDLQSWGLSIAQQLPNGTGRVQCAAGNPVSCQVSVSWSEKTVALNGAPGSSATQTYTLLVQP